MNHLRKGFLGIDVTQVGAPELHHAAIACFGSSFWAGKKKNIWTRLKAIRTLRRIVPKILKTRSLSTTFCRHPTVSRRCWKGMLKWECYLSSATYCVCLQFSEALLPAVLFHLLHSDRWLKTTVAYSAYQCFRRHHHPIVGKLLDYKRDTGEAETPEQKTKNVYHTVLLWMEKFLSGTVFSDITTTVLPVSVSYLTAKVNTAQP